MQKITPHLWFDKEAREAAELYVSAIPNSRIDGVTKLSETPSGDCDLVSFTLGGQPFMAISAGPLFRFNPSISFHIKCDTVEEVDRVWERLAEGGKALMPLDTYPFSQRFGWLEDRFGLSWQVSHAGGKMIGQVVTPVLLFAGSVLGKAEEAINYYASVFADAPNSSGLLMSNADVMLRHGEGEAPEVPGTVRYAEFTLAGQQFGALDSAHDHKFAFNEAVSLMVPCDTQAEIDYFWDKLAANPDAGQCGWIKDRYGVSWQVTPTTMGRLLGGGDKARAQRVTRAFLKMKKFDIAELERAAAAGEVAE
ncbi:MAG: VOC family protein [Bryobacterales bacterium]|nr:VOC family protein [Bryobacterales bacterium]